MISKFNDNGKFNTTIISNLGSPKYKLLKHQVAGHLFGKYKIGMNFNESFKLNILISFILKILQVY